MKYIMMTRRVGVSHMQQCVPTSTPSVFAAGGATHAKLMLGAGKSKLCVSCDSWPWLVSRSVAVSMKHEHYFGGFCFEQRRGEGG